MKGRLYMKTPNFPDNPVLWGYKREKVWDAFHRGAVAIIRDKKVFQAIGDIEATAYLRSSEKPFQSVATVACGAADAFNLDDEEVAIIAGSHNGEPIHVEVVKRMLAKGGFNENNLLCGTHGIYGKNSYERYKLGFKPEALNNNCSGKHAGMLLMCRHMGHSIENYYDRNHPIQKYIKQTTAAICEYPVEKVNTGVDGCGVPVHSMPIKNMAVGFANLANPENGPKGLSSGLERVRNAMVKHPLMIGGHHRLCTDLNALPNKVAAKGGAEGVYCFGIIGKNAGAAMKFDEGVDRGWQALAPQLLFDMGIISDEEYQALHDTWIKSPTNCRDEEVAVTEFFVHGKKMV